MREEEKLEKKFDDMVAGIPIGNSVPSPGGQTKLRLGFTIQTPILLNRSNLI